MKDSLFFVPATGGPLRPVPDIPLRCVEQKMKDAEPRNVRVICSASLNNINVIYIYIPFYHHIRFAYLRQYALVNVLNIFFLLFQKKVVSLHHEN